MTMSPDEIRQKFAAVEARVARLENEARESAAQRARTREEQRQEFAEMMDGAKRSIEDVISRSSALTKLDEVHAMAKESAEERVRRAERDRIAAEAKVKAVADKADQDERDAKAAAKRRDRFDAQMRAGAVVIGLITALGGAFGACHLTKSIGAPNGSASPH